QAQHRVHPPLVLLAAQAALQPGDALIQHREVAAQEPAQSVGTAQLLAQTGERPGDENGWRGHGAHPATPTAGPRGESPKDPLKSHRPAVPARTPQEPARSPDAILALILRFSRGSA